IAVGEPILEDFLLRSAKLEADVDFDGGNALLDEAVLITADEGVAERLGIGDGLDAHSLSDGGGACAEIGFFDAVDLENLQRNDGKKHVHVDVGDDGFRWDRRMSGEVFGAEKTLFFGGDEKEEDRALKFFRMSFEARGNVHDQSAAGAIVHGTVVDAVAVDGRADTDVIDM